MDYNSDRATEIAEQKVTGVDSVYIPNKEPGSSVQVIIDQLEDTLKQAYAKEEAQKRFIKKLQEQSVRDNEIMQKDQEVILRKSNAIDEQQVRIHAQGSELRDSQALIEEQALTIKKLKEQIDRDQEIIAEDQKIILNRTESNTYLQDRICALETDITRLTGQREELQGNLDMANIQLHDVNLMLQVSEEVLFLREVVIRLTNK